MYINKSAVVLFVIGLISSASAAYSTPDAITVFEYVCSTGGEVSQSTLYPTVVKPSVKIAVITSTPTAIPSVATSLTAHSPGPTAILTPSVPLGHDVHDITHLAPCDSAHLYYTQDGVSKGVSSQFAHVTTNYTSPVVILDHSALVQSVACSVHASDSSVTDLKIQFATSEAYLYAKSLWLSYSNLLLASYQSGCGVAVDQRTYWEVQTMTFGDSCRCVVVVAVEKHFNDCVSDMVIEWGNITPVSTLTLPVKSQSTSSSATRMPSSWTNSTSSTSTSLSASASASSKPGQVMGTCGTPPSSIIDGFPASACVEDFDEILDKAIGYLVFTGDDAAANLGEFVPDFSGLNDVLRRDDISLEKRWWSPMSLPKKVAGPIYNKAKSALSSLPGGVGKAFDKGFKAIEKVVDYPFNPSVSKSLNINIGPKDLVDSPFGKAAQLYQKTGTSASGTTSGSLTVYCVDCGFQSKMELTGKITVSVFSGLTAGSVNLKGNVHAGLGIGLDAQFEYKDTFSKPLFSAGLPGFSIPAVITIGPVVSLAAEMTLEAKAQGQLLAAIAMDMPNFDATLDVINFSKSSATGFTPVFTNTLTAKGEVALSATFGLPLKVAVGLVIPLIKFDKSIGIIEKPGIKAEAAFTGSTNPDDLADMKCPNGISYSLSLINDLNLDFFGKETALVPQFSLPLAANCIPLVATTPVDTTPVDTTPVDTTPVDTTPVENTKPEEKRQETPTTVGVDSNGEDITPADNEGVSYITILDTTSSYALTADADGNFYVDSLATVSSSVSLFVSYGSVVATDDSDRLFHFYDDTMAKYGVSRLRLSTEDLIPKTAQIASFVALDTDGAADTSSVLVVADLKGIFYYTVLCTIDMAYSKVFLVNDIDKGVKTLQRTDLQFTVTGGVVNDCTYIPFMTKLYGV